MDINAIWDELKAGLINECKAALEHAAKSALEPLGAAVDMLADAVMSKRRQAVAVLLLQAAYRMPRDIPADQADGWPKRISDEWDNFARN